MTTGRRITSVWNGFTRAILVVFAALLTLQSSDELDLTKVAYLAIVAVVSVSSLVRLWRARGDPRMTSARPLIAVFLLVSMLCALSAIPAFLNGTDPRDWLRDTSTYGLFAIAPILAIDAWLDASPRWIAAAFIVAGTLATMSFVLEWLERRRLADLPIDRLLYPSFFFAAGLSAFLIAVAVRVPRYRWPSMAGAGLVLAALLLTETRSSLILLAAPGVIILAGWRRWWRPAVLAGAAQISIAVLVVGLTQPIIHADPAIYSPDSGDVGAPGDGGGPVPSGRFDDVTGLIDDPQGDPSFRERVAQTTVALQAFQEQPILGVGTGHRYDWVRVSGERLSTYSLDTPFVFLAKFGVVGLVALAAIVVAAFLLIVRGWREGPSAGVLALLGFLATMAAWLPFGYPLEDKGSSLALILLLPLALPSPHAEGKDPLDPVEPE